MKKKFCTIIMMVFMILLLVGFGVINCVHAQGYERTSWSTTVFPTFDGMWTSDDEWNDGEITTIGEDVAFRSTWDMGDDVMTRWIIEFFSDTTDDAEDYWEFCMDGNADGGSAPQADDFKFVITGNTDLVWYQGDGTGWTVVELDASEMEWAASLSESPTDSTPHQILEFQIPKNSGTVLLTIIWNLRVGVYDASNPDAGVLAWPEGSDADDPSSYGIENYQMAEIPEGLSLGVLVMLSSAAVVVASVVLRKRSKK